MKKIILLLALVVGSPTLINAQSTGNLQKKQKNNLTPEERAKSGANWAEKNLALNSQQKSSWEIAALQRITSTQPYYDKLKGSTTPEERKELRLKIKSNRSSFEASITTFLTVEQKIKFDQLKKEKHVAHKSKMKSAKDKESEIEDDDEK